MARSGLDIRTQRLRIRDFQGEDLTPTYIDSLNDKKHMRLSSQRTTAHTLARSKEYVASFEDTPNYLLAIQRLISGEPVIGSISVYFSESGASADLGIFIIRDAVGDGLGSEAWCSVVDTLIEQSFLSSVTAGTARSNHAMRALMARAKMELDHIDEGALTTANGIEDALRFRRATRCSHVTGP